jgi:beta-glucosidase/6-phospho-beta-glucosidase/beta-galactosidase
VKKTFALALLLSLAGCGGGDDATPDAAPPDPDPIAFGAVGSLGPSGAGSWRFGAASAATQIEDMNPSTDWYLWTLPEAEGGLGKGKAFVGDASGGYSRAIDDIALVTAMNLDSYRFSIEWARIEPVRDQIDTAAVAHYRALLEALRDAGIRPVVTIHHFSNPVWVADPRDRNCNDGVSDANLCGLGHPTGGPQIIEEMAEHAGLLAAEYGDLVDEWGTLNEPINYLFAAYAGGQFPPGRITIGDLAGEFMPIVKDYVAAHVAMYRAIDAADTVDADGDGDPAIIGLSMSVADWQPARNGHPSDDAADAAARDRLVYAFHYAFVDSAVNGTWDATVDGTAEETHPEWAGTVDWIGLQYYFRAGVTAQSMQIALLGLTPCFSILGAGQACIEVDDPSYCVPAMGYEAWPSGFTGVLTAFAERYPGIPLVVSEAGLATKSGERRAQHLVRTLEAVAAARDAGADVRGFYYWSLFDNFEWAEGFGPRFGLYTVDYTTFARTPTEGATMLGAIAAARGVTVQQRKDYGGTGPMTPEPGSAGYVNCAQEDL